jgi:hypothetical protein
MNIEQLGELLIKNWGTKPLDLLRQQAEAAATNVAYDAVRSVDGKRLMLAVGVAKKEILPKIQKTLGGAPGPDADWSKLTLLNVAMRAMSASGLVCECCKNPQGELACAVVVGVGPGPVAELERMFALAR